MKKDWTADEVARAHAMSRRPPQVFASSLAAADRHLKLAGLRDLVDPADPVARAGVRIADGGWVAAAGPAPGVRRCRPARWRRSCRAARHRCGWPPASADPMVGLEAMRRVDPDAVLLDGCADNAHWEAPEAVWSLLA